MISQSSKIPNLVANPTNKSPVGTAPSSPQFIRGRLGDHGRRRKCRGGLRISRAGLQINDSAGEFNLGVN
jgi:hypothetical protein